MFTGIVTDVGEVADLVPGGDLKVRIRAARAARGVAIGASIACDGVCLTVTATGTATGTAEGAAAGGQAAPWFEVDVSAETLARTTLGDWRIGRRVNLERSLRVGDELGGHLVSGHVDGVAEVVAIRDEGDSLRVTLRAPGALAPFIAEKGSVALAGTSLTVNAVRGAEFDVNLIPHTREVTTWADVATGARVNLEIDTLARYVARLREFD